MAKALILTHILQTEVKSQVNALKKRLQREPPFPDGPPSGGTVMGACQIATQTSHLCPESAHCHGSRRLARTLGQDGKHQRINHLTSRALRILTGSSTQLQQAYGKRRQQTQQAYQAINTLQLSLLNATPAFEALV